jgi:uncharacterized membrane protein YeaQ/YmgE (transglycosylase-associated protein family)
VCREVNISGSISACGSGAQRLRRACSACDPGASFRGRDVRYIIGVILLTIPIAFLGAVVGTAAYSGDSGLGKLSTLILGVIGALVTWIVASFVGIPILEIEAERRRAIQVAEANAFIGTASVDHVRNAKLAVAEVGTTLRAYARTSSRLVRLYCQWCGYDLEQAARTMFAMRKMIGLARYGEAIRNYPCDYLYICLNACSHLSRERIAEVKQMIADTRPTTEQQTDITIE